MVVGSMHLTNWFQFKFQKAPPKIYAQLRSLVQKVCQSKCPKINCTRRIMIGNIRKSSTAWHLTQTAPACLAANKLRRLKKSRWHRSGSIIRHISLPTPTVGTSLGSNPSPGSRSEVQVSGQTFKSPGINQLRPGFGTVAPSLSSAKVISAHPSDGVRASSALSPYGIVKIF